MSDRPIDFRRDGLISKQDVPQIGIKPEMHAADPQLCIGGPCDGQQMRVAPGDVLIIVDAKVPGEPLRAVSLTPKNISLAKSLGTYVGHYVSDNTQLHWTVDD